MTNDQSSTAPAIQVLAESGLIELPIEVSETFTRGIREQTINGRHYSSNDDREFWVRNAQYAMDRFIDAAQSLANTVAVRNYFAVGPTPEQMEAQIQDTRQYLSSLGPLTEDNYEDIVRKEKVEAAMAELSDRLEAAQRNEES